MSDNAPDTRQHSGSDAGDSIGRAPNRAGAARRPAMTAGEPPPAAAATAGATSRHLREAAGTPMRRATDAPHSVGESATRHLQDMATRLAATVQDAARDMQAMFAPPMFALGGPGSAHLQDLSEAAGTVVESMMRSNARLMQELFRMTSPAAAIDLQRRATAEYLDTMLHGTATLFRAAHRAADHALRPLEQHVAQRRQHHTAHPNGQDEPHNRVADVMRAAPPMVSPGRYRATRGAVDARGRPWRPAGARRRPAGRDGDRPGHRLAAGGRGARSNASARPRRDDAGRAVRVRGRRSRARRRGHGRPAPAPPAGAEPGKAAGRRDFARRSRPQGP